MVSMQKAKLLGPMLFALLLNQLDFWTDVVVVLEYGCFIPNNLELPCAGAEPAAGNATNATTEAEHSEPPLELVCRPHWWWFGIAGSMLLVSTVVPAFIWVYNKRVDGPCSRCGWFLVAVLQLGDLFDFAEAARVTDEHDVISRRLFKDLSTKCLESVPQAYFQGYVLYRLGAHGQLFKVGSFVVSCLALGYSLMDMTQKLDPDVFAHPGGPCSKALFTLFWATDLATRTGAVAMAFVDPLRPWAGALLGLGPLLCGVAFFCIHADCVNFPINHLTMFCGAAVRSDIDPNGAWKFNPSANFYRYVETALLALLALLFTQTACGTSPTSEATIFAGLFSVNLFLFLLCRLYVNDAWSIRSGRAQRASDDDDRTMLGRPRDSE
ncbi:unnamed protein product [Symbiodinium natans]|uniref:Uncharacterized protein n=1 Tax=Symbiodinium natans TaxID=878477 RepID=A0A812LQ32_9DINO|nr:unnamed protein product [Symbiodinium natans]